MMVQETAQIASVASVVMGQSPPGKTYNDTGEGLPLLNGPTEFGSHSPDCTLFTNDSRRECEPGDLLFCVRGSTTGRMNWADRKYSLGRGVCSVRGGTAFETRFIRYCIQDQLQALLKLAGGGTFPNLKKADIEQFEIPWPENRFRIAGILSAYDDLIENSQRRIRILEAMARALHREWFVQFRFPGHDDHPHVPSPLGEIPEGWEVMKLGGVCRVIPGFAFKSNDWQESGVPVIKIKNIQPDNAVETELTSFVSEAILNRTQSKFILGHGDILLAMTGATAGKLGKLRTNQVMLLNQRVAKLVPIHPFREFIWCSISTEEAKNRFFLLADGAAQPNMSGAQIEGVSLLCPPKDLAEKFSMLVKPMLEESDSLYLKIQNLRRTRDLLLPRLLSGQIELEAA